VWRCTSTPLYVMSWGIIKHRDNLTFYVTVNRLEAPSQIPALYSLPNEMLRGFAQFPLDSEASSGRYGPSHFRVSSRRQ
jgi:hypothetical protein